MRRYNHWEQKGVPLRVELGPKDVAEQSVVLVRRDTNAKESVKWSALATRVPQLLEQVTCGHHTIHLPPIGDTKQLPHHVPDARVAAFGAVAVGHADSV
jgi:prolyl-tRNA synthetase